MRQTRTDVARARAYSEIPGRSRFLEVDVSAREFCQTLANVRPIPRWLAL